MFAWEWTTWPTVEELDAICEPSTRDTVRQILHQHISYGGLGDEQDRADSEQHWGTRGARQMRRDTQAANARVVQARVYQEALTERAARLAAERAERASRLKA